METFSALLAFCAGNSPITGEFPAKRPLTRGFVFFDLCLNQKLSKQWRRRWFETPSRSLWRDCYDFSRIGRLCWWCLLVIKRWFCDSQGDSLQNKCSFVVSTLPADDQAPVCARASADIDGNGEICVHYIWVRPFNTFEHPSNAPTSLCHYDRWSPIRRQVINNHRAHSVMTPMSHEPYTYRVTAI